MSLNSLLVPCNDKSVAKIVFLSWFLREVCSFRDAEKYGLYTQKEIHELERERQRSSIPTPNLPSAFFLPVVNFVMNFILFGIPKTYLAHVKRSFEYRGRLAAVQANWERYIERLVREYSHFLLIVSRAVVEVCAETVIHIDLAVYSASLVSQTPSCP